MLGVEPGTSDILAVLGRGSTLSYSLNWGEDHIKKYSVGTERVAQLADCLPTVHEVLGSVLLYPTNLVWWSTCNPSIQETEAGGSGVGFCKFKVSLGYVRPCLETNKKRQ